MKYFGSIDSRPDSPTYKEIKALGRMDRETGVVERYDPVKGWVDYPALYAALGIGGDTDWRLITEEEAEAFIKRKRKDWDDPPDTKAGWSRGQKDALGAASDLTARAYEAPFRNAAASVFDRELTDLLAIIAGARKAAVNWERVVEDVKEYLENAGDQWRSTFVPLFRAVIKEQNQRWAALLGLSFDVDTLLMQEWFDEYVLIFAQDINLTTKKAIATMLQQAIDEGWSIPTMQKHLTEMFEQWMRGDLTPEELVWYQDRMPPHRTEMIARTETIRASNAGSLAQFISWGIQEKEWLATSDERTRTIENGEWGHLEASGQVVGAWDTFIIDGPGGAQEELYFPGDPAGSPSNTIQCRCTVLPVLQSDKGGELPKPSEKIGTSESGHWGHRGRPGQRGGSLPGGWYLSLNKRQRREARIGLAECQKITNEEGIEAGIGIAEDGSRVDGVIRGNSNSIFMGPLWDEGTPVILIHSHPGSAAFSPGDFRLFAKRESQLHDLVIGDNGTIYRASKKPGVTEYPTQQEIRDLGEYALGKASDEYWLRMEGKLLVDEVRLPIWRECTHKMAEYMAKKLDMDYQRILPYEE